MSISSSASFDSDTDSSVDLDRIIGDATNDETNENGSDAAPAGSDAEDGMDDTDTSAATLQPREGENPVAFGARTLVNHLTTSAFSEIRQIYDKHALDIQSHFWCEEEEKGEVNSNTDQQNSPARSIFTSNLGKFPFQFPATIIFDGSDDAQSGDEDANNVGKMKNGDNKTKNVSENNDFSRAVIEYGIEPHEGDVVRPPNRFMTWDKFEGGWTSSTAATAPSSTTNEGDKEENGEGAEKQNVNPHASLKLAPYGTRTRRYAFEDEILDPVMAMPLRRLDIFFVIDELQNLDPSRDDASDVMGWGMVENDFAPPLFLWAASVIRWRLVHLGDRHGETVDGLTCLSDFIYMTTMYILEERALISEIARRRKGGVVKPSDWKLLKPLRDQYVHHREQCRKLLLHAVINITYFSDGPLDMPAEVIWGFKAQRIHSIDDRVPLLDLEETDISDACDALPRHNIRRWTPPSSTNDGDDEGLRSALFSRDTSSSTLSSLIGKSLSPLPRLAFPSTKLVGDASDPSFNALSSIVGAEEEAYWSVVGAYLSDNVSVVTIPHPLQQFPVELRNPGLSTDSGCTCDICSCRNIRITYEARKQTSHHDDNSSVVQRAQFQFTSNLTRAGFDVCPTCMSAITSEAALALLSSAGVIVGNTNGPVASHESVIEAKLTALALAEAEQRVSAESKVLDTDFSCFDVSVAAIGVRNTFSVNNSMLVGAKALVDWSDRAQGKGTLSLFVSISPLGARPVARLWSEDHSNYLVKSAWAAHPMSMPSAETLTSPSSPAATCALRILHAASMMNAFVNKAIHSTSAHQVCNDRNSGAKINDDECPICLEFLNASSPSSAIVVASTDGHCAAEDDFSHTEVDQPQTADSDAEADGVHNLALQTACGHWFHTHCLERFMLDNKCTTCPVCRTPEALESLAIKHMKAIAATNIAENARLAAKREEEIQTVRNRRKNIKKGSKRSREENSATENKSSATGESDSAPPPPPADPPIQSDDAQHVTPEMVLSATKQTLSQNVYQLRIPFTVNTNGTDVTVFVGAIVGAMGGYNHFTDMGSSLLLSVDCGDMK